MGKSVKKFHDAHMKADVFKLAKNTGMDPMGEYLNPEQADASGMDAIARQAAEESKRQSGMLQALSPQQTAFGSQLADQALGKAPSLADMQLRMAQDRNLSQQLAAAKSMRGGNAGLASRNLQNQGMQQGQQTAQAAAMAKIVEQQQNQRAFSDYLSQQQGYNSNLLSGASKTEADKYAANATQASANNAFTGGLMQTAGSIAMMFSDRQLKKNIKPAKNVEPKKLAFGGMAGGAAGASGGGMDMGSMMGSMGGMMGGGKKPKAIVLDPSDMFGSYIRQAGGKESSEGLNLKPSEKADWVANTDWANKGIMNSGLDSSILNQQMGSMSVPTMMSAKGGKVPGQAKVPGDSEVNDTVHALLSPDEVVVPRTVAQAGPEVSGRFVAEASSNPQFDSKKFLDGLKAYTYEYKDPKHGQGQQTSVMAQDLEKSPQGREMVVNTSEGKAVDYAKGYGHMLAAQADLNKRLAQIEDKYKKPVKKEKA